jgi:hypothetical protein
MDRGKTADLLAMATIGLIVFLFFFRLFFPTPQLIVTPDFGQSDATSGFATKVWYANALSGGRIPLWTSLVSGGYPKFAEGEMGALYPPNIVISTLLPAPYVYNALLAVSVALLGWGMYAWLRTMQYDRLSSLFGGITASLSGYAIVQFTHLMIVESFSLFPVIAAILLLYIQNNKTSTLAGLAVCLSAQILVGFPQGVFITWLFLAAYAVYLLRRDPQRIQKIIAIACSLVVAGLLSAVQILPSIEYLRAITTSGGFSPEQATLFSYPVKHLITLFNPFLLGNPAIGTYPHFLAFDGSIFWENTAYIGIIPLLCLLWGAATSLWKRKRPSAHVVFFLCTAAASLALAAGKHSPLYFIFSFWPFTLFRAPSRFIWILTISLIVLSTSAFHAAGIRYKKYRLTALIALFVIAIHTLSLFTVWSPYHAIAPTGEWLKNPSLTSYVDHDAYTVTVGGERLYNAAYSDGWSHFTQEDDPTYVLRNTFTPDKNTLWGVPQIKDYAGRALARNKIFDDLLDQTITTDSRAATISAFGQKILTLLSVKNIISTLPLTQEGLLLRANLANALYSIDLYENPNALGTAYFAKRVLPVRTVAQAIQALMSDDFVPGETVLTETKASPSAFITQGDVQIKRRADGEYVFSVSNSNEGAILVISQTYMPGWRATIDDRETNVFPVNIKHIGLTVPLGNHTIHLFYLPESFLWGARISMISLGAIVLLIIFELYRSRARIDQKVQPPSRGRRRSPARRGLQRR